MTGVRGTLPQHTRTLEERFEMLKMTLQACVGMLMLISSPLVGATLSFAFTPPLMTAQPGETVAFSATITNTGGTTAFLNGTSMTIPVGLSMDDTLFFLNVPASLAPGGTFTGAIANVTLDSAATPGVYSIPFTIIGGDTQTDLNALATSTLSVQYVPEPATCGSVVAGVLAIAMLRRRQRTLSAPKHG